ncbi:MAG: transglutaminase family protein [Pyrinomonadaceae bacterium]
MHYRIFHITKFAYSSPVTESVMEVRMEPRTDERQRCTNFNLQIKPSAKTIARYDHHGNRIHQFDIPGEHTSLEIKAESVVEVFAPGDARESVDISAWDELDLLKFHADFWEFSLPSEFAQATDKLKELAAELGLDRHSDPMSLVRELNTQLFESFSYDTEATTADSTIDVAIENRRGVCQDFSNIMIALLRYVGIPSRYVSGYLFHREDDRSHVAQDSTHAWVEAYIPGCGWCGFDPTNNTPAGERHLRVAVGRDYADVPPTRGVFKGVVESSLSVAVRVSLADEGDVAISPPAFVKQMLAKTTEVKHVYRYDDQQQQQQQ